MELLTAGTPYYLAGQPASCGVFARLKFASELLSVYDEILFKGFTVYLREQFKLLESLQFFVMDIHAEILYRYEPLTTVQTFRCLDESTQAAPWVAIQLAYSIVVGNISKFMLSKPLWEYFSELFAKSPLPEVIRSRIELCPCSANADSIRASYTCDVTRPFLVHEKTGRVIFSSVYPSVLSLVSAGMEDVRYLERQYGVVELMDEFDLQPTLIRDRFVTERAEYLLYELRKSTPLYSKDMDGGDLFSLPVINGSILATSVPPYGAGLLATDDQYTVAFATGGTTGRMKFVYRNEWEDKENARYLAKGLYAQGMRASDVVMNCLSGGFWGGSHVFSLALSFIGCSVIPLGMEFSSADCVQFIQQLKPSCILGLPSAVVALADYVFELKQKGNISVWGIDKCITGGEMMLPAMKDRIGSALGVTCFLSTGYTSNETGAIGFPCRYLPPNNFHIHENMQHVSVHPFADKTGEHDGIGRIITSNLNRTLMPIVRYDVGDSGKMVDNRTEKTCRCGRRLRVMQLCGRWDDRIRIAGEDLYLEEIDKALSDVPGLSLVYSLHIAVSERVFDTLSIHIECSNETTARIAVDASFKEYLDKTIAVRIGCDTSLVWSAWETDLNFNFDKYCKEEDMAPLLAHYSSRMSEKFEIAQSYMDQAPSVYFYEHGKLPRNARTGKIKRIVDHRK